VALNCCLILPSPCCFAAYQPSAPHLRDETRSVRSPKSLITFWTLVGFVLTPDTIIYLLISLFYFSHRFPCSPDRIDMPPDHSTPSPTIATPLYHFICPRDRHCTSCMTYAYSCFALSYLTSLYYLLIRFHYFTDPIYYLLMIYSSYYQRRHITILVVQPVDT